MRILFYLIKAAIVTPLVIISLPFMISESDTYEDFIELLKLYYGVSS